MKSATPKNPFVRNVIVFGILLLTVFTTIVFTGGRYESLMGQVIPGTPLVITPANVDSLIQGHVDNIDRIRMAAALKCPDYDELIRQLREIRSKLQDLSGRISAQITTLEAELAAAMKLSPGTTPGKSNKQEIIRTTTVSLSALRASVTRINGGTIIGANGSPIEVTGLLFMIDTIIGRFELSKAVQAENCPPKKDSVPVSESAEKSIDTPVDVQIDDSKSIEMPSEGSSK